MAVVAEKLPPATTGGELQKVAALLGGAKVLSRPLASPLDAHELLLDGLPASHSIALSGNCRSSARPSRSKRPSA